MCASGQGPFPYERSTWLFNLIPNLFSDLNAKGKYLQGWFNSGFMMGYSNCLNNDDPDAVVFDKFLN